MAEKKTNTWAVIVVAAASAIGAVGGSSLVQHFTKRPQSIDRELASACSEINQTLPMTVDKDTRLDTTVAVPGKTMIYRYTLVNLEASDIDSQKFAEALRPGMLTAYKTNDSLKAFRDRGVTMKYHYSDKNGSFVTEIEIRPEDIK